MNRTRMFVAMLVLAATLSASMAGIACGSPSGAGDRPTIVVSILPQKAFVERLVGDAAEVVVMIGPGDSPATYDPKPTQIAALERAVAYVRVRVPFERAKWSMLRDANPNMAVIDLTEGIELRPLPEHSHGEEDGHDHHGHDHHDHAHEEGLPDPHVWLSPTLVKGMVGRLADRLAELIPAAADRIATNRAAFEAEIDQLHADLQETLAPVRGGLLLVHHPAWGYFAADYGLRQVAFERGGQVPSAAEFQELLASEEVRGAGALFVQPQFQSASVTSAANDLGLPMHSLDPLAEDWAANLRAAAATIARVLPRTDGDHGDHDHDHGDHDGHDHDDHDHDDHDHDDHDHDDHDHDDHDHAHGEE